MNKINVIVCNRDEAEGFVFNKDMAVISIYTPSDTCAIINHPMKDQVLHLCFSDISNEKLIKRLQEGKPDLQYSFVLFTKEQAEELLTFVDKMIAMGVTQFLVHCDAGLSRSPGVAVALNQIYNGITEIPYRYQLYNTTVYRKIMEAKALEPLPKPDTFVL